MSERQKENKAGQKPGLRKKAAFDLNAQPWWPTASAALTALLGVGLFWLTCLGTANDYKRVVMGLAVLVPAAAFLAFARTRDRITLPVLALLAVVVVDLLSVAWAVATKFALYELLKVVAAFSIAILLLVLTPGDPKQRGRNLAFILTLAVGLASLISIDTLSTHLLSDPFLAWENGISASFLAFEGAAQSRMTSVFLNPNVFAGCAGIAVLLGLGLLTTADGHKARVLHGLLLVANSVAFLLANSRGAMLVLAGAFLVYLLAEPAHKKFFLLLTMLAALACAGGAVLMALRSGALGEWAGFNPVPLAGTLAGGVALGVLSCALAAVRDRLPALRPSKKLTLISQAVIALVAVGAGVFAGIALTSYREPLPILQEYGTMRAFYPKPGDYTVSLELEGEMQISIRSQTRNLAIQDQYDTLYDGDVTRHDGKVEVPITVPEGTTVAYLMINVAQPGSVITSAHYAGEAGEGDIPLGYKYLPRAVADRIQAAFQSYSFQQRLVYVEDGLKLFAQRPLLGYGMGGFENAIPTVQTTHYESKYAHNQYIQAMVDTGLVGLLLFVGLLAVCGWSILRSLRRKEEGHPMAPALLALLLFMAGHSAVEVNFSYYAYLPFAYAAFALIGLCCGDGVKLPGGEKVWHTAGLGVACVVLVAFAVMLGGNLSAAGLISKDSVSLEDLQKAAGMDPFEKADYMLSYTMSALPYYDTNQQMAAQADAYAEQLAQLHSNTIPFYLTEYYFKTGRTGQAMDMALQYVNYVPSDQEAWDNIFTVLAVYQEDSQPFREGVLLLWETMEQWNANNLGTLTLSDTGRALVTACGGTVPQMESR